MVVLITIFTHMFICETAAADKALLMKIHFIDVGQGDSILIETPADKVMLIDGGPPEAGEQVTSYLKAQQIDEIDLLVSTHPDIDHIGGLINVIEQFPVKKVIDSGKQHTTKTYRKYIRTINKKEIPFHIVKKGDQLELDPNLHVDVLNSYEKGKTNNESALAFKIKFKEKQFLLLSDIEKGQEREIVNEEKLLQSHLIKVAHHGSQTSSSMQFLRKINPQIAILTYDRDNEFGHPAPSVISNLHHLDVHIYSTAVFGHTVYLTDGYDYLLQMERTPLENLRN